MYQIRRLMCLHCIQKEFGVAAMLLQGKGNLSSHPSLTGQQPNGCIWILQCRSEQMRVPRGLAAWGMGFQFKTCNNVIKGDRVRILVHASVINISSSLHVLHLHPHYTPSPPHSNPTAMGSTFAVPAIGLQHCCPELHPKIAGAKGNFTTPELYSMVGKLSTQQPNPQ